MESGWEISPPALNFVSNTVSYLVLLAEELEYCSLFCNKSFEKLKLNSCLPSAFLKQTARWCKLTTVTLLDNGSLERRLMWSAIRVLCCQDRSSCSAFKKCNRTVFPKFTGKHLMAKDGLVVKVTCSINCKHSVRFSRMLQDTALKTFNLMYWI